VDVMPGSERRQGNPAALLDVWGSDVPEEVWDAVEQVPVDAALYTSVISVGELIFGIYKAP
jgi:hypothetical protein